MAKEKKPWAETQAGVPTPIKKPLDRSIIKICTNMLPYIVMYMLTLVVIEG